MSFDAYCEVNGQVIDLNQSRVGDFGDCHRLFYNRWVRNLESTRTRWALEIGTAVHRGLAVYKEKLSDPGIEGPGPAVNILKDSIDLALKEMKDALPKAKLPGDDEELEKAEEIVTTMVPAYLEHWGPSANQWISIAQEVKGRVEVGRGTGIFIVFRTDQLVVWNKRLWILDTKTAGRMDIRDFMKYEMDLQFTAYYYAVNKYFEEQGKGVRVAGIIVDACVKTKVPQFKREMYFRNAEELAEFEAEWCEVAREILWRLERVKQGEDFKTVFYKRTKHCFAYSTCVYRDLCLKDTPAREAIYIRRKTDYVDDATSARGKAYPATGLDDIAAQVNTATGSGEDAGKNGPSLPPLR